MIIRRLNWGLGIILSVAFLYSFKSFHGKHDHFPDGTEISSWFYENSKVKLENLGKQYNISEYGAVNDSTVLNTQVIQKTIDLASASGGGVIVIPKGVYLSGALFFKPKTHLYLAEGAVLKGSDNINDYPKIASRMEGQNLDYFAALVNVYGVDNFTISGTGTIDGNGKKFWEAFWKRREENKNCTNLEVSRPRLVFFWNSNNIQLQDVKLHNSGFWSSHYYKCNNIKILDLHIFSPHDVLKAPSTDAIDIDVCTNVLVKGCYMSVNDDAIALKGGKGPWADTDTCNGPNSNIIVEDCTFGFCHSALTFGSESVHTRNVIMRNCTVSEAQRLLWLKMRPDTPQKYEYVLLENIKGEASRLLYIKPWTQFFDLKGRKDVPLSYSENITLRNIEFHCEIFADLGITKYDRLRNFSFENLNVTAKKGKLDTKVIENVKVSNVIVNNKPVETL